MIHREAVLSTAGRLLRLASVFVAATIVAAGCATRAEVEQRTTQGPTALQMFNLRVLGESGREPTFEEKRVWDQQVEDLIGAYLRKHPEKASALDVSTFRFLRQVAVGMDKEQVLILLGAPALVSGDQAQMEKIARRYWPQIQGNATEVWVYPLGWNMFFAGQRLIDITQYVPPS
ncbi:MAG TPA: hypothetical protein VFV05_20135 [Methylomirabilota bacterium]|nr:hypothetical protein [Methylomirabilota bacterium]